MEIENVVGLVVILCFAAFVGGCMSGGCVERLVYEQQKEEIEGKGERAFRAGISSEMNPFEDEWRRARWLDDWAKAKLEGEDGS